MAARAGRHVVCGGKLRLNQIHRYAVLHQQFRVAVAEHMVLVASDGHGAGLLRPAFLLAAFRQDIFKRTLSPGYR